MRAVLVKQPGSSKELYLGETAEPLRQHKNDLLVEVKAIGVNRADILQREGKYPPPPDASEILGLECAGIVLEASPNSKYKPGDAVMGLVPSGAYAEQVIIHEGLAQHLPEGLSFEEAAAMPEVYLTAYQALCWQAQIKKGERILIHAGASGVGTAAIQIAKQIGAEVIVTASAKKHALCQRLGASLCIDYQSEDFAQYLKDYTKARGGVEAIIDFIGASYFERNLDSLSLDGRMVILGLLGGVKVESLNLAKIVTKRLKIMGSTLRARSQDYQAKLSAECWAYIMKNRSEMLFKPVIDEVFDWKDVRLAHEKMERNENAGKIVLKIS